MYCNIVLQRTIPPRTRIIKDIQPQLSIDPVWHSRKISIVCPRRHLHRGRDPVVAFSSLIEVARLEVEARFGEAVPVRKVVYCVHKVEDIHEGGVEVHEGGGVLSWVLGIQKLEVIARLRDGV